MFSAAAAFSPDLNNLSYNVNLPVDADGNIIEDVWQLWLQHDPLTLAEDSDENLTVVEELNLNYFLTMIGGKTTVFNEVHEILFS